MNTTNGAGSPLGDERQEEKEEPLQAKCEACEEEQVQRSVDGTVQAQHDLESRLNSSQGGGNPLPDEVRGFMESRFGTDFSQVRVHTDGEAVQMNQELGAQAFTHGSHIYYGAGKAPAKDELTGHELTHVVQQTHHLTKQSSDLTKTYSSESKVNTKTNVTAEITQAPTGLNLQRDCAEALVPDTERTINVLYDPDFDIFYRSVERLIGRLVVFRSDEGQRVWELTRQALYEIHNTTSVATGYVPLSFTLLRCPETRRVESIQFQEILDEYTQQQQPDPGPTPDPTPDIVITSPHSPTPTQQTEGITLTMDGEILLSQFDITPVSGIPCGLYATAKVHLDGMVNYTIGPAEEGHSTTQAQAGIGRGGAHGHGGAHGRGGSDASGMAIQAQIAHHLAELPGNSNLDVTFGGDLAQDQASVGFTLTGGTMIFGSTGGEDRFGSFAVPLPTVGINLFEWDREDGFNFFTIPITIPFPASATWTVSLPNGLRVRIMPHLDLVIEFHPRWDTIIPAVARYFPEAAAQIEAVGTAGTAIGSEAATGTAGAAIGGEATVGATGTGALVGAEVLILGIGAPLLAGAGMLAIFAHDVGVSEELQARARGTAHNLFNYCMSYTMTWFGDSIIGGTAGEQGAQHARRDIAEFQRNNPDVDTRISARNLGPHQIYSRIFEIMRLFAEQSLRQRAAVTEGSFDDLMVRDRIGQVRWNGRLFNEFGSASI